MMKKAAWRLRMLAALAVACCAAPYAHADDLSRVLMACGTPTRTEPSKHVIGFTTHVVHYKNITLRFASADDSPALGTGFLIGYRGANQHSLDKEVVGGWLPCFHNAFAPQPEAAPKLTSTPSSADNSSDVAFLFWFLLIIGVPVGLVVAHAIAWSKRPERLCIACGTIRQPSRYKNKRFYCPTCAKIDPIPLGTPVAQEYLRRQAVDHRNPPPPTLHE